MSPAVCFGVFLVGIATGVIWTCAVIYFLVACWMHERPGNDIVFRRGKK